MLEHLIEYGDRIGLEPEPGFKAKWIKWAIVCGKGGEYLGVSPLGDASLGKRNQGREFRKAPDLTQPQMLSGPKNCRHFLADALSVVTLLDKDKPNQTELAKHEFFKELLRQAAREIPEVSGLADLLDDPANRESANRELKQAGAKATDNVTFMRDNVFLLDSDCWHGWWGQWWQENCPLKTGDIHMPDLVTGRATLPLTSHFKISGLAGVGGQSSGDALVSFDKDAFQSYGLSASANAAFSPQSAVAYAGALNHLIRHHGHNLAGVKVVPWFKNKLKDEENLFSLLLKSPEGEERQAMYRVHTFLTAVIRGKRPDLAGNRYYSMTISGAAGRVMLRDWMEGSYEELAASINTWFDELALTNISGKKLIDIPEINSLITCSLKPKKPNQKYEDWIKPVKWEASNMWKAALKRTYPIPGSALNRVLISHNKTMLSGEYFDKEGKMPALMLSLLYWRMALIKAYHNRQYRLTKQGGRALTHLLDESHPSRAYQCGRLMALLEKVQNTAQTEVKSNIISRYYAAAAASPATVFARLISLSHHHLQKIRLDDEKKKYAPGLKNQIAAVMDQIEGSFPDSLNLKEQSLFALGYYQQIAFRQNRSEIDTDIQSEDKDKE